MSLFNGGRYDTFGDWAKATGEVFPAHVVFRKPIFEDDFVEAGMRAYLTGVEVEGEEIKLFFYFGDDFDHNKRMFRQSYYGREALGLDPKKLYTALETNDYQEYYSVYAMKTDKILDYLCSIP